MKSSVPPTAVILPAAGIGSRMQSERPKQFLPLGGMPVLVHTCRAFLALDTIALVVLVCHPAYQEETVQLLRGYFSEQDWHRILFIPGGARRQDSVAAGIAALPESVELVLVHDAARPLVDRETILRVMEHSAQGQPVIAAIPAKDTLKQVTVHTIRDTIDRSIVWMAQTPQAASKELLQQAFAHALTTGFQGTDEASVLEHFGIEVQVVQGSEQNFKITRPEDLALAEKLISRGMRMKIGHGYDAHRLVAGRKLILGGVEIDYPLGLEGHSDADVLCHALTDAVFGALGAGDIGQHFPDSDKRYQGISSLLLLEKAVLLAQEKKMALSNADLTILCQQPKLAPYLSHMRELLAKSCSVPSEQINLKATTTEKMGFVGRGEGIAAHAVVLLQTIA